jgi:hypothetical protein
VAGASKRLGPLEALGDTTDHRGLTHAHQLEVQHVARPQAADRARHQIVHAQRAADLGQHRGVRAAHHDLLVGLVGEHGADLVAAHHLQPGALQLQRHQRLDTRAQRRARIGALHLQQRHPAARRRHGAGGGLLRDLARELVQQPRQAHHQLELRVCDQRLAARARSRAGVGPAQGQQPALAQAVEPPAQELLGLDGPR